MARIMHRLMQHTELSFGGQSLSFHHFPPLSEYLFVVNKHILNTYYVPTRRQDRH